MVHIQAGIDDTDDHAFALIVRPVGKVQGLAHRFGRNLGGIQLPLPAAHHPGHAFQRFQLADAAIGHLHRKAGQHGGVAVLGLGGDAGLLHPLQHLLLQGLVGLQLLLRRIGGQEFLEAVCGRFFLPALRQAPRIQFHNHPDQLVRLGRRGAGNRLRICHCDQIFRALFQGAGIRHLISRTGLLLRALCRRVYRLPRRSSQYHHQRQQQRQNAMGTHSLVLHLFDFLSFF